MAVEQREDGKWYLEKDNTVGFTKKEVAEDTDRYIRRTSKIGIFIGVVVFGIVGFILGPIGAIAGVVGGFILGKLLWRKMLLGSIKKNMAKQ